MSTGAPVVAALPAGPLPGYPQANTGGDRENKDDDTGDRPDTRGTVRPGKQKCRDSYHDNHESRNRCQVPHESSKSPQVKD
jgi:hypothetical protein